MFGERAEQKNAVDAFILVHFLEFLIKFFLGDICGKDYVSHFNADKTCALCGASLIGEIIRALTDTEDAERRRHTCRFQVFYILLHLGSQGVSNFFSLEYFGHTISFPLYWQ